MDRLTRIYRLHRILKSRHRPVPMRVLQSELEYTLSSIKRIIRDLRIRAKIKSHLWA